MWQVLAVPPPYGLGLQEHLKTIRAMMLAEPRMTEQETLAAAVACYATSRTVQCVRFAEADTRDPQIIIRLFLSEGLRGGRAKKKIRHQVTR